MMVSPAGKEPAALQWKISVPEGVTVAIADVTAGDAAKTAEKVLTCADVKQATAGATVACILAGGQKPISDGSIAMVKVTMRAGLSSATVRIREALGVSANLKSTKIPDAEGTISVK